MNIIALDLSTHKTGYAIFVDKTLKSYGLLEAEGEGYHERIFSAREQIMKKIKEFNIEYIVLEEVPINFSSNLKVAHDLCVCQGAILGVCAQFSLGLKLYAPTAWRSIMETYNGTNEGKKRNFQKERAVSLVNEIYGLAFEYWESDTKKHKSDDDICEAILLGLAFLKEGNKNE